MNDYFIIFLLFCSGIFFISYYFSSYRSIEKRTRILTRRIDKNFSDKQISKERIIDFFVTHIKENSNRLSPLAKVEAYEYEKLLKGAGEPYNFTAQDLLYIEKISGLFFSFFTFYMCCSYLDNIWISLTCGIAVGYNLGILMVKKILIDMTRTRILETKKDMLIALDMMGICSGAGSTLRNTLHITAQNEDGLLYKEIRLVVQNIDNGVPFEQALYKLTERLPLEELNSMYQNYVRSLRSGIPIEDNLLKLGASIREKNKSKIINKTSKATQQILLPLFFLIVPAILIVIFGPMIYEASQNFFS